MEAEATDRKAQLEGKGEKIHTVTGKWLCRQSRCNNNNGICWFERPGAPHWKVLLPEVEKWARKWQAGEEGVDANNPPFDMVKTPVDQSARGKRATVQSDTPIHHTQPVSINVHSAPAITEPLAGPVTSTSGSSSELSALLNWLTPIVSSAINRPLHSGSSIQLSDMLAASNQLAASYPGTDLMKILQALPNSQSYASPVADQIARALSALQAPRHGRSTTPPYPSQSSLYQQHLPSQSQHLQPLFPQQVSQSALPSTELMSSPQTGTYTGAFTCKAWIRGFKTWVLKRWKDIKTDEDMCQIHETFDTLTSQWYDYEPLKKATDATWERFNIPLGLGKRLQNELPFFKQAVKENAQLMIAEEEETFPTKMPKKKSRQLSTAATSVLSQHPLDYDFWDAQPRAASPTPQRQSVISASNSGLDVLLAAAEMQTQTTHVEPPYSSRYYDPTSCDPTESCLPRFHRQ